MRRIVISDGDGASVTLLPELEYTVAAEEIGTSATMASGREVFDFVGEKNALSIPTGWLSADDLVTLRDMIRREYARHPRVIRLEAGINGGTTDLVLREL